MAFNINRAFQSSLIKDSETKLIVPTNRQLITGLVAGAATTLAQTISGEISNANSGVSLAASTLSNIVNTTLMALGVTSIEVGGQAVIAKTKGIGSIGEIIHLMGSKNEELRLEFTTDLYPGALANLLKRTISSVLDNADIVYVVDELLTVAPCLIETYKLRKVGKLKTAIQGELKFIMLRVKEYTGIGSFLAVGLGSVAVGSINNMITALPQEFKWMGEVTKQKKQKDRG